MSFYDIQKNIFSDDIEDIILENVYEIIGTGKRIDNINILTESVSMNPSISKYSLLIEAVDAVAEVEKDIEKAKTEDDKENIFKKLANSLKKLYTWYFKEDPDKKCKKLRVVLKVTFNVLLIVLPVFLKETTAAKKAAKLIVKTLPVKHKTAKGLVYTAISSGIGLIGTIDQKVWEKANKKDIDNTMKEYEDEISKLEGLLEKTNDPDTYEKLLKLKHSHESSLAKLARLKNGY